VKRALLLLLGSACLLPLGCPFSAQDLQDLPFACSRDQECSPAQTCVLSSGKGSCAPRSDAGSLAADAAVLDGGLADFCHNSAFDPDAGETDYNCGGPCAPCTDSSECLIDRDCHSGSCRSAWGRLRCAPGGCTAACAAGERCRDGECIPAACGLDAGRDPCLMTELCDGVGCRPRCDFGPCPTGTGCTDASVCEPMPTVDAGCDPRNYGFQCGAGDAGWGVMLCVGAAPVCQTGP
jgi:hypothetical protein